jgi:hypothetical protein
MKKLNPSTHARISSSTKRPARPAHRLGLLLQLTLLGWCSYTGSLRAQDLRNDARLLVMKSQTETQAFFARQEELARSKELERTNIPQYNIDLSLAVSRFHKHIADMHQRHVSCSICREHVKKIKELAKKIDQGMK